MEGNPFECPLCMEYFDADLHIPTTFACGHSCCMSHLAVLRDCFICRQSLSSPSSYHPTYALRDGSMLYKKLREPPTKLSDEEFARILQQQWIEEDSVNLQVSNTAAIGPSTLPPPPPPRQHPPPPPPPRLHSPPPRSILRWLQQPEPSPPPPPPPLLAYSSSSTNNHRRASFLNIFSTSSSHPTAHVASESPLPPPPPVAARSGVPMVRKSCNHFCSFSSLNKCCGCMDLRPVVEDGTYPVYMDGTGWVNCGRRSAGYCPVCKNQ